MDSPRVSHVRVFGLVMLLTGGWPSLVAADPIYAYSTNHIRQLFVSGATLFPVKYTTKNEAEFDGFGKKTTEGEADALKAESGPGPGFPDQNFFDKWGHRGEYARADSQMGARTEDDRFHLARNVAEAHLVKKGSAWAEATWTVRFELIQDTDESIDFEFAAERPQMEVETGRSGDLSQAFLNLSLNLFDAESSHLLLNWVPCGRARNPRGCFLANADAVITGVNEPYSLNESLECKDGPCHKFYDPDPGFIREPFKLSFDMKKGKRYVAFFSGREKVVVAPEPSTFVLVGIGIAVALRRCCARGRTRT